MSETSRGEHHELLRRHCYRLTGTFSAAEAITAEVRRRAGEAASSGVDDDAWRAQLYRFATDGAVEYLQNRDQRQILIDQLSMAEPTWLEPYPTGRWTVGGLVPGDNSITEPPEIIAVSHVVGLQLLPVAQRIGVLLRDVVGLAIEQVAVAVGLGERAADRLLDAARFTLECHRDEWPEPTDQAERQVLCSAFATRWGADDSQGVAECLAGEVSLLMPAEALTIHGPRGVMAGLSELVGGQLSNLRLVEVELNGRYSWALYLRDSVSFGRPFGFLHLDTAGDLISRLTVFEPRLFGPIGLPSRISW